MWLCLLAVGCSSPREHLPGRSSRDSQQGGLFGSYLDGKYDSAGHPFGASVFEAESACSPDTGELQAEGWGADAALHSKGLLCKLDLGQVGPGPFTLNVRLLTPKTGSYGPCPAGPVTDGSPATDGGSGQPGSGQLPGAPGCPSPPEVVTLRVLDGAGVELASKTLRHDQFRSAMTYQNLWVDFSRWSKGAARAELSWSGLESVRVDYLELFRSMRRAVISPSSGVLDPTGKLELELLGSPLPATATLSCGETDLAGQLAALLQSGEASSTATEFRTLLEAPVSPLLDSCSTPVHLLARGTFGNIHEAASRITLFAMPIPCGFDPGKLKVLLTGFEAFPATSNRDNSSEQAVQHFDPSPLGPSVSVMKVILPVEWDAASGIVTDLIDRCKPDVVIGFGQGRYQVEPETVAYNLKDASDISGGVPDNRGIVFDGVPIVSGGPSQHASSLPTTQIAQTLASAGIGAGISADPGRYICNNLFYSIMHRVQGSSTRGGFIHLPVISKVDAADRARLQTVVQTAVRLALEADEDRLLEVSFDGGAATGWGLVNSSPLVGWHVSAKRGAAGSAGSLRYGDPSSDSYDDAGVSSKGTATAPSLQLPSNRRIRLALDLFLDTGASTGYDKLSMQINGKEVWAGTALPQKEWQRVEVDLTHLAGQTVAVALLFDTVDAINNDHEGVYIDNLLIAAR